MTTFSYTTGDPTNLDEPETANMVDIKGSFEDVEAFLNGSIDATNLATSVKPITLLTPFHTILQGVYGFTSGHTAGVFMPTWSGVAKSGTAVDNVSPIVMVRLVAADFAVSGLTPKLRISSVLVTNSVAPVANFTYGLYPIASTAGAADFLSATVGTVVTGSTVTRTAPAASSMFRDTTSSFDFPSDGVYALGINLSAQPPANSGTFITSYLVALYE